MVLKIAELNIFTLPRRRVKLDGLSMGVGYQTVELVSVFHTKKRDSTAMIRRFSLDVDASEGGHLFSYLLCAYLKQIWLFLCLLSTSR